MSRDEPILIRSFPDLISADMALTALAAASIEANLLADDLGGALPAMHPVRGVKLYVSAENEAAGDARRKRRPCGKSWRRSVACWTICAP